MRWSHSLSIFLAELFLRLVEYNTWIFGRFGFVKGEVFDILLENQQRENKVENLGIRAFG